LKDIAAHNYGFNGQLPANRIHFQLKSSAKLFGMLSDGIYQDKILAVIRELSCNAHDAHITAQRKTPFIIKLPTKFDPVFAVEDQGTGIDPSMIGEIYWTYGESSKTNDNSTIGALGLGSKSPFAYTKSSFIVKNRFGGREYTYFCFINEVGTPDGSLVGEEDTTLPSGISVEMAVKTADINVFHERARRFFKYWPHTLPTFIDATEEKPIDLGIPIPVHSAAGQGWFLEEQSVNSRALAIMGGVPYPIDADAIPDLPGHLSLIVSNPFVITFDMGSLNFTPSREHLQYDERSSKNVIDRLDEIRGELSQVFQKAVFAKGMTQLGFMENFRKTFYSMSNALGASTGDDEFFTQLFLNKTIEDKITYGKNSYKINHVLKRMIRVKISGHQSFGLWDSAHKENRNRSTIKPITEMIYTAKNEMKGDEVFTNHLMPFKALIISKGDDFKFPWRSTTLKISAKTVTRDEQIIAKANLFDVATINLLTDINPSLTFVLNDDGGNGENRFRLYANTVRERMLFVRNDKANIIDVKAEVERFIDTHGLGGAKVLMVSSLPDLRPAVDKIPKDRGSVKLRHLTIDNPGLRTSVVTFRNMGVRVNVANVSAIITEKHQLIDLVGTGMIYVVKRMSGRLFYDDATSTRHSVIHNDVLMLAVHLDLVLPQSKVFALTLGELEYLKKRNVPLLPFSEHLKNGIIAMETKEKFIDNATRYLSFSENEKLTEILEAVESVKNDLKPSLFLTTLNEYLTLNTQIDRKSLVPRLRMYERMTGGALPVVSGTDAKKLFTKYKLLSAINWGCLSKTELSNVADYINLVG